MVESISHQITMKTFALISNGNPVVKL